MERGEYGELSLDLRSDRPLIAAIGIAISRSGSPLPLLHDLEPVIFLTVGTRVGTPGRPPSMSIWTGSALRWAQIDPNLPQFPKNPPLG